jgi:hypothetical protein
MVGGGMILLFCRGSISCVVAVNLVAGSVASSDFFSVFSFQNFYPFSYRLRFLLDIIIGRFLYDYVFSTFLQA